MINNEVINACKNLSFPEAIKRLIDIGIERYYTDLVRMEKVYYSISGEYYSEPIQLESLPTQQPSFNESKVIDALKSIKQGEIDYNTFIKNMVAAGTVSYTVYIEGKQVVYVGRKGETYIEKFQLPY